MSRRKRFVKRVLLLAVTAVSIYLVVPSVIATFSSWPELQRLRDGSLVVMTLFTLASLACFWIMQGLCLRSHQWGLMASSQLSSAAVAAEPRNQRHPPVDPVAGTTKQQLSRTPDHHSEQNQSQNQHGCTLAPSSNDPYQNNRAAP